MAAKRDLSTLQQVLDLILAAGGRKTICVEDLLDEVGPRSFGPLLLVPSLVIVSPLCAVPGIPTFIAIIIALVAVQMLFGRKSVWLPRRIRRRCVNRQRLEKVVAFLRPGAAVADRLVQPRLTALTHRPFSRFIAVSCLAIAFVMPPLELIPGANHVTGVAIAAFGLALVAHDGVLAIIAFIASAFSLYFAVGAIL